MAPHRSTRQNLCAEVLDRLSFALYRTELSREMAGEGHVDGSAIELIKLR
jgi:hypothetical protein